LAVSSRQGKRNNLLLLAAKELELTSRETITKNFFLLGGIRPPRNVGSRHEKYILGGCDIFFVQCEFYH